MHIGFGYDLHRLKEGNYLILGGVKVPFNKGIEAHSDGDVLLHALIDALLGACGLEDIGHHFPPSQAEWAGISSRLLLHKTMDLIKDAHYYVVNIDSVIVLEKPKLAPFRDAIIANLAEDLEVAKDVISVKAKTKEGLGEVGEGKAIEAFVVALLEKK